MVARIYLGNGATFATYVRESATADNIPPVAQNESSTFAGGTLRISRDIIRKGDFLGSIFLELDLQELNLRRRRYVLIASAVLLLSLLSALLLASQLQRTISAPIFALAQQARSIPHGTEYQIRGVQVRYREIALLIESFNDMLRPRRSRCAIAAPPRTSGGRSSRSNTSIEDSECQSWTSQGSSRGGKPRQERVSRQHEP
jgi:methyl-accepting chemotaxis protein